MNGSSEYDGEWYTAVPEIRSTFEMALSTELRLIALGDPVVAETIAQEQANILNEAQPVASSTPAPLPFIVVAGLAILLAFAIWFRKSSLDQQPKGG